MLFLWMIDNDDAENVSSFAVNHLIQTICSYKLIKKYEIVTTYSILNVHSIGHDYG